MIEYAVLRNFCDSKETYSALYPRVRLIRNLASEVKLLFTLIHKYYDKYEEDHIEEGQLHVFYDLTYPNSRDKEFIHDMIEIVFGLEPQEELARDVLEQMVERHAAAKIADMLAPTISGDKFGTVPDIRKEVDAFIDCMTNPPEDAEELQPCETPIDEMLQAEADFEGYTWPMDKLNETLGGIKPETLGLIYAYVDSGKTSFAMNIAAHVAQQLDDDQNILYMGNEESAIRLRGRLLHAFVKKPRAYCISHPREMRELAEPMGFERVKIVGDVENGDQIVNLLDRYRPVLAFVDIATDVDVQFGRTMEGVRYLKALFKWYRRLANRFETAILGIAQGTGEAENRKYLKLSDIYDSRSGIQGNLDYGIGIGRLIDDLAKEKWRYINIPKNKLYDGGGMKFATLFEKEINKWTEEAS